jgi:ABC-type multidrug transport system fused ATPase/permease subunit
MISDAYAAEHRPDAPPALPERWRSIEISGVSYAHREAAALSDVGITLRRGRRIALIGASGSGKSTLLALLRGLYVPRPGLRVEADGAPASLDSVNEMTTLFPQDPEIFENTIAYNVTLGLPFSEADVREACETAHFTEVIAELPKGLESNIQEKGVNLSGGQKQRLALARGILAARASDVVLLDEPTSSVDPKTEAEIYQKMFAAFRDKAVVSALHRLHLLRLFDEVIVMSQGRVVARGGFEELLRSSVEFQELWRHQQDAAVTHPGARS